MIKKKYSKAMVKKAKEYLDKYKELGQQVPTYAGLARYLGVDKATVYKWQCHLDFKPVYKALSDIQEIELVNKGLDGSYNQSITKLLLASHGYHDKVDSELKADVETTWTIKVV